MKKMKKYMCMEGDGMGEYILNTKENINIINNKQIPKEIDR